MLKSLVCLLFARPGVGPDINSGLELPIDQRIPKVSHSPLPCIDQIVTRTAQRRCLLRNSALLIGASWTAPLTTRSNAQIAVEIVPQSDESFANDSAPTASGTKPYAMLESLLPATRVKQLIDESVTLAADLVKIQERDNGRLSPERDLQLTTILGQLQLLLLQPQNFITSASSESKKASAVPKQPAQSYLDAYERNRQPLNAFLKPSAMLVQRGEIDAWKRLKRKELEREEQDEIRAAFNMYTTSLTFTSVEYVLTVPKQVRSEMVRNDQLPDVLTQVIASDMGLRYLYRNDVLTAMQDSRAELRYIVEQRQRRKPDDEGVDGSDLLGLLRQAQEAANQWFALIDEGDVNEAKAAIRDKS